MEYSLTMIFLGGNGEKTNFTLNGVKDDITQAEVSALMDTIIEKDIFLTKNGALTSKYGASLTEKSVTKFNVR
ncbi:MAG: DUF2922 domain-containing protein [Clostridium sp.]